MLEGITRNTLAIGTCRVKRPRIYLEPSTKKSFGILASHVHYPAEILQMLKYIHGDLELPKDVTPLIIDNLNNGGISSFQIMEEQRVETLADVNSADQIIVEVSSLKKKQIHSPEFSNPMYANITSLSNLENGVCKADFIDGAKSYKKYNDVRTSVYDEQEFLEDMVELVGYFKGKSVILVSHFQACIPETGKEIEERKVLGRWLANAARNLGCSFFDQTEVVRESGADVALKDTAHYTEEGERQMANVLTSFIRPSNSGSQYLKKVA